MNIRSPSSPIRLRWLGLVPYQEALDLMRAWTALRHQARHDTPAASAVQQPVSEPQVCRAWPDLAEAPVAVDEIWLLQHPRVFTLGMNSEPGHLLAPGDIPVVPTERGGQVTYHGPGQIMAYLMLDLRARKLGIRVLVERIEDALINCLADYGITAFRQDGAPGIYVHPRKPAQHWTKPPDNVFSAIGGNEGISALLAAEASSAALPYGVETFAGNESGSQQGHPSPPRQQPGSDTPEKDAPPAQRDSLSATPPAPSPARPKTVRHLGAPAADVAKIASIGLKTSNGFSYHGLALNGQMDLSPFLRINPCGFHRLQMTDVRGESPSDTDIDLEQLALNLGRALKSAIER